MLAIRAESEAWGTLCCTNGTAEAKAARALAHQLLQVLPSRNLLKSEKQTGLTT